MKKYLLFILAICAAFTANAQMATTYKNGAKGSRLVSNDNRNICFRTVAKRLYADLNPATHNKTNLNTNANDPEQISYMQNGLDMNPINSEGFNGFTEVTSVEYSNETVLNTLQYYNMNGTTATTTWNVGQSSDTYYGSGSSDATNYVDLTGFDELRIYRDSELGFRAFFINATGTGTNKIDINSTNVTWNGSYFAIDLSKVEKYNDKIYLNTIKSESYGINNVVNNITVCNVTNTTASRPAKCSYTYDSERKVGTFSFANVRTGNSAVNLFDGLKGKISDFENFVIRTLNVTTPYAGQTITIKEYGGATHDQTQTARFCLQFCREDHTVIHEFYFYSDDIKIVQLKEFFKNYNGEDQFEAIDEVWLSTAGGDPSLSATVQIAEAYFITPYDLNKTSNEFPLGEYFYDMDDEYIGNAYIHPSYFMMSNGVNFDDNTGVVSMDMNVYSYVDLNKTMFSNVDECQYRVGMEATGNNWIYGNLSDKYTDLADYDNMYVRFDQDKAAPALIFNLWNLVEINSGNVQEFVSNGIVTVMNDGWKIDIQKFIETYGTAHLNFIKAQDENSTSLVTSILLEKIQERGNAEGQANATGRICLSVPFEGFDMSDVTIVSMDNAEDGDVIGSWITGYEDYFSTYRIPDVNKQNKRDGSQREVFLAEDNHTFKVVRQLYVSRYYGEFEPPVWDGTRANYDENKNKINFMTWHTKNDKTYAMTLYNICITKNHVIARNGGNHSKLTKNLFNNQNACAVNATGNAGATLYGDGGVDENNYADLSKFYKMQIKGTPKAEIRILGNTKGKDPNKTYRETLVRLDANGLANLDIAAIVKEDGEYKVNAIKVPWGGSATTIDYFKLYGDEDGIIELNDELYHTWNRDENTTVTRRIGRLTVTDGEDAGGAFVNNIGKDVTVNNLGTIFGSGYEFFKENYAELTGYKTIRVWGDQGVAPRLIYNCSDNMSDEVGYRFKDMSKTIGADGYVDFDIHNYIYFHLNSIKNAGAAGKVSKVELISDDNIDYVLEGNGTLSANANEAAAIRDGGTNAIPFGSAALEAINDVGARVIDTRPRVNLSRASLVAPANPNCLYLMRHYLSLKQDHRVPYDTPFMAVDGQSYTSDQDYVNKLKYAAGNPENFSYQVTDADKKYYANMVLIWGSTDEKTESETYAESDADYYSSDYQIKDFEADNITLFDGYAFSAPREIKYTNAKLTRKTTGGKIGTLILPFECADVKGDAYETTYAEYAETASKVGKGILGDIFIDANDHVLLYQLHEGNAAAYMPYLYVADETSDATVFNAVSKGTITKTPEVGPEEAPAEYMTNNYQDQKDRHYLRGFMESTHVENMYGYNSNGDLKRATKATMTPFRVMIQAPIDVNQDAAQQAATGGVKILLAKFDENNEPTEIKVVDAAELEGIVDVYSVNGALIKKSVKAADAVNSLPKGVYVIGGKKIVK